MPEIHIGIFPGINLLINFKPQAILPANSGFMTLLEAIFVLLEFLPVKEPVQQSSESLRQRILSIFMVSESQNCYHSSSLCLLGPSITPSVFTYVGVIRGHKAQYYPTGFNPNGVKMAHIIFNIMAHIICKIFLILI